VNRKKDRTSVQVGKSAQITLPSSIRKELGIQTGDVLIVSVADGSILLTPCQSVVRELQTLVKAANPKGLVLSRLKTPSAKKREA
jgi:AbrB family looped-hinge helix DNA binding protein